MENAENLVKLFHEIGKLKEIIRKGWTRYSIENPESVAAHIFRVSFIAMLVGDKMGVDKLKLIKMALIHDAPEARCGDITPYNGISAAEKKRLEEKAIKQMFSGISGGEEYIKLWEEFEKGTSKEAKILREIDKFEMMLQAMEYESKYGKNLSEFVESGKKAIKSSFMAGLARIAGKGKAKV